MTPEELQRAQAAHDEAITRRFGPPEPPSEGVDEVMDAWTRLDQRARLRVSLVDGDLVNALDALARGPS